MDAILDERFDREQKVNPWPSIYKCLGKDKLPWWERAGERGSSYDRRVFE
jgi:hypothetical protein